MVIEKMSFLISVDRGQFGGFVNYTSYVNSLLILQRIAVFNSLLEIQICQPGITIGQNLGHVNADINKVSYIW